MKKPNTINVQCNTPLDKILYIINASILVGLISTCVYLYYLLSEQKKEIKFVKQLILQKASRQPKKPIANTKSEEL